VIEVQLPRADSNKSKGEGPSSSPSADFAWSE